MQSVVETVLMLKLDCVVQVARGLRDKIDLIHLNFLLKELL